MELVGASYGFSPIFLPVSWSQRLTYSISRIFRCAGSHERIWETLLHRHITFLWSLFFMVYFYFFQLFFSRLLFYSFSEPGTPTGASCLLIREYLPEMKKSFYL